MKKLLPSDIQDLTRSGLTEEYISKMGVYSLNRMELERFLERTDFDSNEGGYLIPYFNRSGLDAKSFNIRLQKGIDVGNANGKRLKYCKPPKTENLIYFPPGFSDLYDKNDYVIITEGEKKAAKAVQDGFPCIAIAGVWNWFDSQARNNEKNEGLKLSYRTKPLGDLIDIALEKKILLIFDSDAVRNDQVKAALKILADSLIYYSNSWVRALWIPEETQGAKLGIDDYLMLTDGHEKFKSLIDIELGLAPETLTPLMKFPYSESNTGKKLYYIIPNVANNAMTDVHRIMKQVEVLDNDGNSQVMTKNISSTRIWLNRVLTSIDDDSTLYEMGYIPLATNDVRYISGNSELINLSGRNGGDIYSDRGAPILSKDKALVEEFFHHCQTYGVRYGVVKKISGTKRRGWINYNDEQLYLLANKVYSEDGLYAASSRDVPLLPIDSGTGDYVLKEALKPGGDYNVWRDLMIRFVLPNTVPSLFVSSALCGLLRQWCPDSENFIMHLYNDSSSGKTTALRAAAGVWGNPTKLIDMWRTTDNGLEGRCVARNDMAIFLDEAGLVAHEDILKNSVYMIGNGGEKMRASRDGGERRARNFRLIALSTGERGLLRGERHAGQEVRVLEIPTHVTGTFWDNSISSSSQAERVNAALLENYGFAADKAIKYIIKCEKVDPGCWKRLHAEFTEGLRCTLDPSTPPHIIRRVKHYGLLLTAFYILLAGSLELSDSDIEPYISRVKNDIATYMLRMSTDQFSGGEKNGMLEHLIDAIAAQQSLHFTSVDQEAKSTLWGSIDENKDQLIDVAYVIPKFLPELCAPYDPARIIGLLNSMNGLIYKNRADRKISVRIRKSVISCYAINVSAVRAWLDKNVKGNGHE